MKVLKHKNILGLIYGVLLMIPFFSVLGRSAYVTMNKNAKDSWSGQNEVNINYKYETNEVNSFNDIYKDKFYELFFTTTFTYRSDNLIFDNIAIFPDVGTNIIEFFQVDFIYNDFITYQIQDLFKNPFDYVEIITDYKTTNSYIGGANSLPLISCDDNTDNLFGQVDINTYNSSSLSCVFLFKALDNFYEFESSFNNDYIIYIREVNYFQCIESVDITQDTLDNAFEYSLKEITNNDIGNVKFFTWFADMFVDVNNGKSAIYVGFINWYFNYSLLVSLGFVLYAVLMWFINWIRRLLEKGQDFGHGGF